MAGTLTLSPSAAPFPWASAAITTFSGKAVLNFDTAATGVTLEIDGSKLAAEDEIVQALAKAGGLSDDSEKVRGAYLAWIILTHSCLSQTASYFALAKSLPTFTAFPQITAALDSLDDHLAFRTFLVGHDVTAADFIVWGALKGLYAYMHSFAYLH